MYSSQRPPTLLRPVGVALTGQKLPGIAGQGTGQLGLAAGGQRPLGKLLELVRVDGDVHTVENDHLVPQPEVGGGGARR
jgi:hypothetical protein